jgi:hypothetical protein
LERDRDAAEEPKYYQPERVSEVVKHCLFQMGQFEREGLVELFGEMEIASQVVDESLALIQVLEEAKRGKKLDRNNPVYPLEYKKQLVDWYNNFHYVLEEVLYTKRVLIQKLDHVQCRMQTHPMLQMSDDSARDRSVGVAYLAESKGLRVGQLDYEHDWDIRFTGNQRGVSTRTHPVTDLTASTGSEEYTEEDAVSPGVASKANKRFISSFVSFDQLSLFLTSTFISTSSMMGTTMLSFSSLDISASCLGLD